MREQVLARTSMRVRRWDAGQVSRAARVLGMDPGAPDIRIHPQQFAVLGIKPYGEDLDPDCNLITQAGWTAILGGIAGASIANKFSGTYGRIGVGTILTPASYADTRLGGDTGSGSSTSWYQLLSAPPAVALGASPPSLTFTATFGTGTANFAWNEFAVDNGSASGVTITGLANVILLDHGVLALGVKSAGMVWNAAVTITFGYPSGTGANS